MADGKFNGHVMVCNFHEADHREDIYVSAHSNRSGERQSKKLIPTKGKLLS